MAWKVSDVKMHNSTRLRIGESTFVKVGVAKVKITNVSDRDVCVGQGASDKVFVKKTED